MSTESPVDVEALSRLMQLEAAARRAESEKALEFLIVNETKQVVEYQQAFLVHNRRNGLRVSSASNIAVVEDQAPFVAWVEKGLKKLDLHADDSRMCVVDASMVDKEVAAQWADYALPFGLWCPLFAPNRTLLGGLWLMRERPWTERDMTICSRINETYSHAWGALTQNGALKPRKSRRRIWWILLLLLVLAIPVRLSTLAPVEVTAANPVVVTAPIDGVVKEIGFQPNTLVAEGDVVITFDDTTLRNNLLISEKALAVAQAAYQQASQGAFADRRDKAKLSVLQSEYELRLAERDYAAELLERTIISASEAGLLLYTDESDWVGKPVTVGQRMMEIANPNFVELKIFLAIDDAIVFDDELPLDVFLDHQPLKSVSAQITNANYHAERTPSGLLAFRITAEFVDSTKPFRIGQQGTAKIYGERVSLAYFLFRRPLSALRQSIGF